MKWLKKLKFAIQDYYGFDSFYLQTADVNYASHCDFSRVRKVSADGTIRFTYLSGYDNVRDAIKYLKSGNYATLSCFISTFDSHLDKDTSLEKMEMYDIMRGYKSAERI